MFIRPANPPTKTRRRWGRGLATFLAVSLGTAIGCSSQGRYKVLSFFFDGVPDPATGRVRSANALDQQSPNAFKGQIVSTHKPFAAGKCDACHSPMNPDEVASVQTIIDSSVCQKCHEPEMRKHAIMHAPVAAGACLFCHNPHNSTQPHLLVAATPGLCTQCHDRTLLGDNPPDHLSETSACLDCHVGHGEDTRGFLLRPVPLNRSTTRPTTAPGKPTPWTPIDMPDLRPATQPAAPSAPAASPPISRANVDPLSIIASSAKLPRTRSLLLDEPANEEGPVAIGTIQRPDPFGIGPITSALEFRARNEHDKIDARGGQNQSFTENRLEEDLTLSTTAYVIHPNLLDIKMSGTFGPRQDWQGLSGQTSYTNELMHDYDVEGTFLRKEDSPVTIYSRRTEDIINQQFGPSYDSTIQTDGGYVDFKSTKLPTHIEVYHSDQDQTSLGGQDSYHLSQNVFSATSTYDASPNNRISGSYTYNNNSESSAAQGFRPTADTFDTHDASLSHSYTFGTGKRDELNSSVSYFEQTGNLGLSRLNESESLHLVHSDQFQTRYLYTLNDQRTDTPQFGSLGQIENDFDAGFTHHLYESLTTSGDAGVRYLDRSDHSGDFDYFGALSTEYRKHVPLGLLTVDMGYVFDQQKNRTQTAVVHVVNESHTFSVSQPIVLSGAAVMAQTIVVKNSTGLIVYIPGSDYLVRAFADRVELSLVIGGRITDGQSVLIDYDLSAQPANRVTSSSYSASVRYDIQEGLFSGVGFFGRYIRVDQEIDSTGRFLFTPNNLNDYATGVDYHRGPWSAGLQYEWHESEIAPYTDNQFFVRYQERAGKQWTYGMDASYTNYDYYREPDRVEVLQASANANYTVSSELSASVSATYLNERDRLLGTTSGYQGTAEIQWTHRQTHVFLQFRDSVLDGPRQTTQFQSLWLGLRRSF